MPLADRLNRLGEHPEIETTNEGTEVPPSLMAAVEEALLKGETHYTVRLGLPELRHRLRAEVARRGGPSHETPIDNVLVTTGESEALFVALLGMALPPGDVLVGGSRAKTHEALFRLMELSPQRATKPRASAPARLVYREGSSDPVMQAALSRFAVEQDLPDVLNLQDALGRPPSVRRSGGAQAGGFPPFSADRTVILGNLDALPGMSAFRLGFVLGPERFMNRIRVWKQALTICSPAPSQRAAWVALGGKEEPA